MILWNVRITQILPWHMGLQILNFQSQKSAKMTFKRVTNTQFYRHSKPSLCLTAVSLKYKVVQMCSSSGSVELGGSPGNTIQDLLHCSSQEQWSWWHWNSHSHSHQLLTWGQGGLRMAWAEGLKTRPAQQGSWLGKERLWRAGDIVESCGISGPGAGSPGWLLRHE